MENELADVWLMNGIPGSGKTTLARRLAESFPRGAHIEGDRVHDLIVAGKVAPGGEPPEEADRQIRLCVRNQCLLACSLGHGGFTPVIDYVVVSRARVEEYQRQLPGLRLHLVTLAPGAAVALQRDRDRPEKTVAALWVHLEAQIEAELQGVGLWIDNSRLSVDETQACILDQAAESLV